ncbi:MAG: polyprenyl diphosphate synthase [Acidobacteriota bacterium]
MNSLWKGFQDVLDPNSPEARSISLLDPDKLPRHIAVIMDGNGRWAGQRNLPRVEGHRAGIQAVKATVEFSARLTIPVLTLFAFSSENWKRPAPEVRTLWNLLKHYLQKEISTLRENDICFDFIGRTSQLPLLVQKELRHVRRETRHNRGMKLILALSYSGRLEVVDAVNKLIEQGAPYPISGEDIERNLYTAGLPEPDLLIRTSGEMRISNFLLWQIAYAEIYVTEVLWPDFRGIHLLDAVLDFQKRERRYGGVLSAAFEGAG